MIRYKHLEGLPFIHGSQDCYTTLQRFYFDNFGIELRNYARPDRWWWEGMDLYRDHFRDEGFELVEAPVSQARIADVFLVAIGAPIPNHCAIYVGDGHVLHHRYGQMSCTRPYRGALRNWTSAIIRHKDVPEIVEGRQSIDIMDRILPEKRRILEEARARAS